MKQCVHEGMDAVIDGVIGWFKIRLFSLNKLRRRSERVAADSARWASFSDADLKRELEKRRDAFALNRFSARDVDDALALMTDAMDRTLGQRPYRVQVMGAIAMFQQYAIEMATGEGKTLTAGLSAVLFAWRGNPCHLVTSNDYLAVRDARFLAPFYEFCGLSVGVITSEMDQDARRENYQQDIVYATSHNLLADYLKDNKRVDYEWDSAKAKIRSLVPGSNETGRVMRGLHTAVVDEADSVLVDDAITPLIISIPEKDPGFIDATLAAKPVADAMREGDHYTIHHEVRAVEFTDEGRDWLQDRLSDFPEEWRPTHRSAYLVNLSLAAKHFYARDKQYVIIDSKVVIVDEKTGRLMNQRSWSHGLHQAVEAREGVALTDPTKISVKMSFQRFFRMYANLSGMSGTFKKIERELWRIYGLPVIRIPTRLPKRHRYWPDRIFLNRHLQEDLVIREIQTVREQGRPVLVGVRTIKDSQTLADRLQAIGVACETLNALNHEKEAAIIAGAGGQGRVTVATNMAGRGTDIVLPHEVVQLGGLHVIATERHESRRVDLQLCGRASRQGQPGSSVAILSMEDPIIQSHFPKFLRRFLVRTFRFPFSKALALWAYRMIQNKVEKRASAHRIRLLIHERKFQKAISFVGR